MRSMKGETQSGQPPSFEKARGWADFEHSMSFYAALKNKKNPYIKNKNQHLVDGFTVPGSKLSRCALDECCPWDQPVYPVETEDQVCGGRTRLSPRRVWAKPATFTKNDPCQLKSLDTKLQVAPCGTGAFFFFSPVAAFGGKSLNSPSPVLDWHCPTPTRLRLQTRPRHGDLFFWILSGKTNSYW